MSGYNSETGEFGLTHTKAAYWFRRDEQDVPSECRGNHGIEFFAALFRAFHYEVLGTGDRWLKVRASPEQVWEVLSGQPSDPAHASYYYRSKSTTPKEDRTSKEPKLLQPDMASRFQQGIDVFGRPTAIVEASGRATCRACGKKITKRLLCVVGCFDPHGNGEMQKCYLHQSCDEPDGPVGPGVLSEIGHDRGDGFVELAVPFEEKNWAKALGAKWDGAAKAWIAKIGPEFPAFVHWIPARAEGAHCSSGDSDADCLGDLWGQG